MLPHKEGLLFSYQLNKSTYFVSVCVCVRGYKRAYNIEIEMNFVFLVATSRQNLQPHNMHQHPQAKLKSKQN